MKIFSPVPFTYQNRPQVKFGTSDTEKAIENAKIVANASGKKIKEIIIKTDGKKVTGTKVVVKK